MAKWDHDDLVSKSPVYVSQPRREFFQECVRSEIPPQVDTPAPTDYHRTHGPVTDEFQPTVRPDYYKVSPGCTDIMDVIDQASMSFQLGSAMKYLYRAGRKPNNSASLELRKAIECIQREILRLERG